MRVLEAAVKKLRIIVLVTSCALLGSTQQGCDNPGGPGCRGAGVGCNDVSQCCSGLQCSPNATSGIFFDGTCRV